MTLRYSANARALKMFSLATMLAYGPVELFMAVEDEIEATEEKIKEMRKEQGLPVEDSDSDSSVGGGYEAPPSGSQTGIEQNGDGSLSLVVNEEGGGVGGGGGQCTSEMTMKCNTHDCIPTLTTTCPR
jgi:hypothetical protein